MPSECPSDLVLDQFASDRLPRERVQDVSTHVGDCPTCQARLKARAPRRSHAWRREHENSTCDPTLDETELSQDVSAPAQFTPVQLTGGPAADRFGHFEIKSELARGGMGCVYVAYDRLLDRDVAIKTLLPGRNARRFVNESKITARLPHPGIPPVHALGTLDDGSPYLAMKLVRGQTLAAALDARDDPSEDLSRFIQVFEQVAQAVGFAHAQGVIHRDLKPSNIMVGAFGEVQVMDWGLAKDLSSADTADEASAPREVTSIVGTAEGAVMGTPTYMAPEQARGEVVDARADVFALGGILTAILTGRPVFHGDSGPEVVKRAADGLTDAALQRLADCGADAELIGIARRCLSADRDERPADGQAVADLIAEHRQGVEQRLRQAETDRAAAEAKAQEQHKRRRVVQVAAMTIAAVLLLGIAGTTVGLFRAMEARDNEKEQRGIAERAVKKEQEANRLTAQRLDEIEEINDTVFDIFAELDIRKVKGGVDPVEQVLAERLAKAGRQLDADAIRDPLILAKLKNRLGVTLVNLGQPQDAIAFLTEARTIYEKEHGPNDVHTLLCLNNLGLAYRDAGDNEQATLLFEQVLDAMKSELGPYHAGTLVCMNNLAIAYQDAGRLNDALKLQEQAYKWTRASAGPDHHQTLLAMNNLARAYEFLGDLERANPMFEEAYKRAEATLGPDHPDTVLFKSNLTASQTAQNLNLFSVMGTANPALAGPMKESLELTEATLGPDHPRTLQAMSGLAGAYQAGGEMDKALPLFEETVKRMRAKLGDDHPDTLLNMNHLATAHRLAGDPDKAISLHEQALTLMRAKLGPNHPYTLLTINNLALAHDDAGDEQTSLKLQRQTFELAKARYGDDHAYTLFFAHNLAIAYQDADDLEQALPLFQDIYKQTKAKFGPNSPYTLISADSLASAYIDTGEYDRAIPLFEQTFQRTRARFGPNSQYTLLSMEHLADGLAEAGEYDRAIPLFKDTLKRMRATFGEHHDETLACKRHMAAACRDAGDYEQAIPLYKELLDYRRTKFGPEHGKTLSIMNSLALTYKKAGDLDKAVPLYIKTLELKRKTHGPDSGSTLTTLGNLARAYMAAGEYNTAIPLFEQRYNLTQAKLGAGHEDTWSAAHRLLDAYIDAERTRDAADLVLRLVAEVRKAQPPDSAELASALVMGAMDLMRAGAHEQAESLLRECLDIRQRKQPNHWTTFNTRAMLGTTLLNQAKHAEAEPLLLAGYEGMREREGTIPAVGRPRLAEALQSLIALYTALDQPSEVAKWKAAYARKFAPVDKPATDDTQASTQTAQTPATPKPTPSAEAKADYDRGYALFRKRQSEQAIAAFDEALRKQPGYVDALHYRGHAYEQLGKTQQAIADFTAALAIEPDDAHLLTTRGNNHYRLRQWDACARDWQRSLELKPDHSVCAGLARLYASGPQTLRNPKNALALAKRALELAPDDTSAAVRHRYLTYLGAAYYRQGEYEKAHERLEEAARLLNTPSAEHLFYRAMACHRLKRDTDARAHLERAAAQVRSTDAFSSLLQPEAEALIKSPSSNDAD